MIALINEFFATLLSTILDVLPIITIIFAFQLFVIRRPVPNIKQVCFYHEIDK